MLFLKLDDLITAKHCCFLSESILSKQSMWTATTDWKNSYNHRIGINTVQRVPSILITRFEDGKWEVFLSVQPEPVRKLLFLFQLSKSIQQQQQRVFHQHLRNPSEGWRNNFLNLLHSAASHSAAHFCKVAAKWAWLVITINCCLSN